LVAYAGLACYHGHWVFRNCVVVPEHRGLGLQRRLIAARLKFLAGRGVGKVSAWVRPTNSPCLNNLTACGFRFRADKPRVYEGHEHIRLERTSP
jgi:ribosomal protein S18 acetylase RimI-like enzyme